MHMTEKQKTFLEKMANDSIMGFIPVIEMVEEGYSVEVRQTTIAGSLGKYSVEIMKGLTYGNGYADEIHEAFAQACKSALAWGR